MVTMGENEHGNYKVRMLQNSTYECNLIGENINKKINYYIIWNCRLSILSNLTNYSYFYCCEYCRKECNQFTTENKQSKNTNYFFPFI